MSDIGKSVCILPDCSCMIPSLLMGRRDNVDLLDVLCSRKMHHTIVFLRIPLFHHPEPPKLSIRPIVETVMIGVPCGKICSADVVEQLCLVDTVDRKWQSRDPRFSIVLCIKVESCRRCIRYLPLQSQVVCVPFQQVRLLPTHEVDVSQATATAAWEKMANPDETSTASSKKVYRTHRRNPIELRKTG